MDAKFLRLAWADYLKGVVTAVITTILTSLLTIVNTGHLPTLIDLKTIGIAGLSAGVAYLIKNLLTNSKNELFKAEPKTE